MTIKSITRLAVAGIMLGSCQSSLYQIEGFARDFTDGDTICLAYDSEFNRPLSFTCVTKGKFRFSGETDSVFLCRAFVRQQPTSHVDFFIEPGATITVELNNQPKYSRVSGTVINNAWQQLADSINSYGKEIIRLLQTPVTDSLSTKARAAAADSLHRQMSDCILRTASRNKDNPLGKYIESNYKAPEFK